MDSGEVYVYQEPAPGQDRTRVRVLHESARDVAYAADSEDEEIYVLIQVECR